MKLRNAGTKIAGAMIAMGIAATAAFASLGDYTLNVTLPEAVSVGKITLPSGAYKVSEVQMGGGESVFVFRNDNGEAQAVATATRTASPDDLNSFGLSKKTEIVLSPSEDGTMHLNELFIEGDAAGYRFNRAR